MKSVNSLLGNFLIIEDANTIDDEIKVFYENGGGTTRLLLCYDVYQDLIKTLAKQYRYLVVDKEYCDTYRGLAVDVVNISDKSSCDICQSKEHSHYSFSLCKTHYNTLKAIRKMAGKESFRDKRLINV
jgi:hypothetical protein